MSDDRTFCVVCAWRGDCQKRIHFEQSGQRYCPDYTRDLTIKSDPEEDRKEKGT